MPELVEFVGGPCPGARAVPDGMPQHIAVAVDQDIKPTTGEPFAQSVYERRGDEDSVRYHFLKVVRSGNKPFEVEFVGGPIAGIQPCAQPVQVVSEAIRVPLTKDHKPFKGEGEPDLLAVYEPRLTDGVWKFHFMHALVTRDHILRQVVRDSYDNHDDSLYSFEPTDRHVQVHIHHGYRHALVDEQIAPVIFGVWKLGLDTYGSCQERYWGESNVGKAYISFPIQDHGHQFRAILTRAGIESSCKSAKYTIAGHSSSTTEPDETIEFESLHVFFSPDDVDRIAECLIESGEPPLDNFHG